VDRIWEMSKRISSHCDAVERAAQLLSEARATPISAEDTEDALIMLLGLENPVDLLDHDWTAAEIAHALRKFDFSSLKPIVLTVVELKSSVLPSGVRRRLDEVKIKARGEVWHIHRNDADPFPSVPHAHNYDSGHTMHLGTGELYLGRKRVGRISRRDLMDFRQRPELAGIPLPNLAL
jgi:hypothetical protein